MPSDIYKKKEICIYMYLGSLCLTTGMHTEASKARGEDRCSGGEIKHVSLCEDD